MLKFENILNKSPKMHFPDRWINAFSDFIVEMKYTFWSFASQN